MKKKRIQFCHLATLHRNIHSHCGVGKYTDSTAPGDWFLVAAAPAAPVDRAAIGRRVMPPPPPPRVRPDDPARLRGFPPEIWLLRDRPFH